MTIHTHAHNVASALLVVKECLTGVCVGGGERGAVCVCLCVYVIYLCIVISAREVYPHTSTTPTGSHGSLELRAMGAQFASFLASRVHHDLINCDLSGDVGGDVTAKNDDAMVTSRPSFAVVLTSYVMEVLQGAAAYVTMDGGAGSGHTQTQTRTHIHLFIFFIDFFHYCLSIID